MDNNTVSNFVVIDSVYGKFLVNRHCDFQAETLIKTGKTHIEAELENIFAVMDTLPANSVVLDGGSNIGFFCIPVAQKLKPLGTKLIAFEPQRLLYYALAGSIALNDLSNCSVLNMGLSDKSGIATLPPNIDYSHTQDFGCVSITDSTTDIEKNYLDDTAVCTISIDEMHLPQLDFIKLDVEGYEIKAIRGAINSIKKFRPILWVEYWIVGKDQIESCFADVGGYSFYIIDNQNMLCWPHSEPPPCNYI